MWIKVCVCVCVCVMLCIILELCLFFLSAGKRTRCKHGILPWTIGKRNWEAKGRDWEGHPTSKVFFSKGGYWIWHCRQDHWFPGCGFWETGNVPHAIYIYIDFSDGISRCSNLGLTCQNYEELLAQSKAMRRQAGGVGPQAAPSGFR